jgi:alanyl-tRNA synthetase
MINSKELRQSFLDYFISKQHKIVASAPMVIKDDPTLMFTNAGMNQFKDIFLGNTAAKEKRIADSQKCLRVSGKHNDLEEVGHDTYHHTMFEMLGNWSFGDYFKQESIDWAWDYLTNVLKIDKNRLYSTVFEGSQDDKLERDDEAIDLWSKHLPKERILMGSKKDNFWEMGDTGPCGPCSEIHVDIRDDAERQKISGAELVNKDHPQVIEIWNLVFIQFNRKQDKSLELLPDKHVDTGMGFERLAMVTQGKKSNYDTDVFQPLIQEIARLSGNFYGEKKETDVAMRVIADHLRAVAFSIADGQVPSNNKAGYVIRRILRRAVRYAYTFLNQKDPFIYLLVPSLVKQMGDAYPELLKQEKLVHAVIFEEETGFLRTLEKGIQILDGIITECKTNNYQVINGKDAFKLYDSYGFPLDLTQLIARENGLIVSQREFDKAMDNQRATSKADAATEASDWIEVTDDWDNIEQFIGYDHLEADVNLVKYRKVRVKNKEVFQLVFNYTPFYAESGGQIGDTGYILCEGFKVDIFDTQKEHNLILHYTEKLPQNLDAKLHVVVESRKRALTAANHSATHLLHQALRLFLGEHVEQKGSLVAPTHLRFDFSHFQKMSNDEIRKVEEFVNRKIRENIQLHEHREVPISEAKEMGAMALFGEKYGDIVRVIQFGDSVEFCGGIHVESTGTIGFFKILKESAIAAGIRRIEAITSVESENYIYQRLDMLSSIEEKLKATKSAVESVDKLMEENTKLQKQLDDFRKLKTMMAKKDFLKQVEEHKGVNFITVSSDSLSVADIKDIAFQLKGEIDNLAFIAGVTDSGKANLSIMLSDNLVNINKLNAGNIVREAAKEIDGSGGGQAFFATAGGKNPNGVQKAIEKAKNIILSSL